MKTFDAVRGHVCQGRDGARLQLSDDGSRRLMARLPMVSILSGSAFLVSGCQGEPVVPMGFGPPLDNLIGVLVLLALGGVLYRLLAPRFSDSSRRNSVGAAESIARERYARGEITEPEFKQMLRALDTR